MITNKLLLGAAALAFVALGSTGASAGNLIVNGNFTTMDTTGWVLTGNPPADGQNTQVIDYTTGDPFPGGAFSEVVPQQSEPSPTGVYFVTDTTTDVTLTQVYTVGTAGKYTIFFDYYTPANGRANPLDGFLAVSNDGTALTNIDIKNTNPGLGWYTFSVTEDLAAGANTLEFDFSVPGNVPGQGVETAADVIVTNVAVSGVPEPATWGMMLLGFFGLGALVRRRAASQAAVA